MKLTLEDLTRISSALLYGGGYSNDEIGRCSELSEGFNDVARRVREMQEEQVDEGMVREVFAAVGVASLVRKKS